MSLTPRLDIVENATEGLGVSLQSTAVNLTYLTPVNGAPGAGQFRSSVTGRASMVDLSNDLMPRMGVERVQLQQLMRVDGERGPADEVVYKPVNDRFDQVRVVGKWVFQHDTQGCRLAAGAIGDFLEITFYGTGLNLLISGAGHSVVKNTDGGGDSANLATVVNNTLAGRYYSQNTVVNMDTGLSLGIHTIKIRTTTGSLDINGFEILNESTTVKVPTGSSTVSGKLLTNTSLQSLAYNSSFESGVLGTRGGRVLVYQKSDGTIAKSLTPTNTSQATLGSTDHTNEEVLRTYYWREFGVGRTTTDDLLLLHGSVAAQNRAFTLDDGVTSLAGADIRTVPYATGFSSPVWVNSSGYMIFTFVGTGLDIIAQNDGNTRDWPSVTLDGVALGAYTPIAWNGVKVIRFASGLPYGTHTIKFGGDGGEPGIDSLIVYGPKKPTLPSGAVELGEYSIMADYSAAPSGNPPERISQGVLRKMWTREWAYSGTWTPATIDTAFGSGINLTAGNGASAQLEFIGTDIEISFYLTSTINMTFEVDGSTNLTAQGLTGTILNNGGSSHVFTGTTGVWTGTGTGTYGNRLRISGLTPGVKHRVKLTNNNASAQELDYADIHTQIYSTQINGPYTAQNTLSLANTGVKDRRSFVTSVMPVQPSTIQMTSPQTQTLVASAGANPTYLQLPFVSTGRPVLINVSFPWEKNTAGSRIVFQLFLDGIAITTDFKDTCVSSGNSDAVASISRVVKVAPGVHHVMMKADPTTVGNLTIFSAIYPCLTIQEITEA